MKRILNVMLSASLLTSAPLVLADDSQSASKMNSSKWTLGLAAIGFETPYRDSKNKQYILPIVNYYGEKFTMEGAQFSYKFFDRPNLNVFAVLEPGEEYFNASDSNNAALAVLSDRKLSYYAGVGANLNTEFGQFGSTVTGDVSDHSDGTKLKLAYSYPMKLSEKWRFTPSIDAVWNNSDANDYYYGVDPGESASLAAYSADSGINYGLSLHASYEVTQNWYLHGAAKWQKLDREIENSPLVDNDTPASVSLAMTYRF